MADKTQHVSPLSFSGKERHDKNSMPAASKLKERFLNIRHHKPIGQIEEFKLGPE